MRRQQKSGCPSTSRPTPTARPNSSRGQLKEQLGLKHPLRAVFNEITSHAVREAIAHPREIDEDLFNAHQARRVLDRLVGYKISPPCGGACSAAPARGACNPWRCASVSCGARPRFARSSRKILDDRRRGRKNGRGQALHRAARRSRGRRENLRRGGRRARRSARGAGPRASAQAAHHQRGRGHCHPRGPQGRALHRAQRHPARRAPPAVLPYTTSTMQQDASVRLHFKPKRTMSWRRSCTKASDWAIAGVGLDHVHADRFDARLRGSANRRQKLHRGALGQALRWRGTHGRTAKASVQDAHEAIRPTNPPSPKACVPCSKAINSSCIN